MPRTDPRLLLKWAATDDADALAGCDLDDVDCVPAATVAVQRGHQEVLTVLLQKTPLPDATLAELAGVAVLLGHHPILDVIATHAGHAISGPDAEGKTLAYLAASMGDLRSLEIIARMAPVTLGLPIRGGATPVDVAWHRGHDACVAWLGTLGIPDPTERWMRCCDGEPCEPKPVRGAENVVS